tara:strand:- start:3773 stop:4480 length:708 start_codon:yes stop_codon:yes gene_type:complete
MFESTKRVLILGNKPYYNLNLNKIIDSFDVIHRFNMCLPGQNNGTKFGNLGMCGHMYQNFVRRPLSKKQIIKTYSSDMSPIFLSCWYDFFQENKEKFDSIYREIVWRGSNGLLRKFGSPHRFSKLLSVGHSAVMRSWAASNDTYVCGFTLCDNEIRKTMGEEDEFALVKNQGHGYHSFSDERDILAWLHNNKKIDASLCMLEDTEELSLKTNTYNTEPSQYILDLLKRSRHENTG